MDLTIVILIVLVALIFDFINGFHDAANSIATVVSTRVLSPKYAVMWAAFFNFLAAFTFEPHVAATIGKGVIHAESVTAGVIVCGLIGAIVWDLLTWWWGLPTSSSHALIGGFAGAAVAKAGTELAHGPGPAAHRLVHRAGAADRPGRSASASCWAWPGSSAARRRTSWTDCSAACSW